MKFWYALLLVLFCNSSQAQKKDSLTLKCGYKSNYVSFITKFDMADLDKDDAAYISGYVVNIGYDRAKKITGKKIKISGEVTIIKDSSYNQTFINDTIPPPPIRQVRIGLYKYIKNPKIKIIKE